MRRLATALVLALLFGGSARADAEVAAGRYGALTLGPRVGPGLGLVSGPRAAYYAGLELTYLTPRYFYYDLEIGLAHLLPTTVEVAETRQTGPDGLSTTTVAPAHEVRVTGLYGVPMTLTVGLRLPLGRLALRGGVGIGAMIAVETVEALGIAQRELVASFCFRPELGVDLQLGGGELRFDLFYLWQDARFELTGGDRDVDSLFVTVGYSWLLAR